MCRTRTLLTLLILAALAGCGSTHRVPVLTAGELPSSNIYIVQRGDTLYSIAFRYGLDYKALAAANGIGHPYTIYVNQRIRVVADGSRVAVKDSGPPPGAPRPAKKPTVTAKPATTPRIVTPRTSDSDIAWRWPYDGTVVGRFSLSGKVNKGIDIKGKIGEPVRSSADGVVVYAGGGLRGYGKLVIVKHNDSYLSAYGHNEKILVKEGDVVKGGQVVAKIGGARGDTDLLHFEIRRNGKPEDPLRYLPSRSQDG